MNPSADYSPLFFADQGMSMAACQMGNEAIREKNRVARLKFLAKEKAAKERGKAREEAKRIRETHRAIQAALLTHPRAAAHLEAV